MKQLDRPVKLLMRMCLLLVLCYSVKEKGKNAKLYLIRIKRELKCFCLLSPDQPSVWSL